VLSKWLRVNDNAMAFLVTSAESMGMVFESPNAVLREILGMDSKKKPSQTIAKKIRIDDDVWERLVHEARKLNMNVRPIDKVLREVSRLRRQDRSSLILRTKTGRPATRQAPTAKTKGAASSCLKEIYNEN